MVNVFSTVQYNVYQLLRDQLHKRIMPPPWDNRNVGGIPTCIFSFLELRRALILIATS